MIAGGCRSRHCPGNIVVVGRPFRPYVFTKVRFPAVSCSCNVAVHQNHVYVVAPIRRAIVSCIERNGDARCVLAGAFVVKHLIAKLESRHLFDDNKTIGRLRNSVETHLSIATESALCVVLLPEVKNNSAVIELYVSISVLQGWAFSRDEARSHYTRGR